MPFVVVACLSPADPVLKVGCDVDLQESTGDRNLDLAKLGEGVGDLLRQAGAVFHMSQSSEKEWRETRKA